MDDEIILLLLSLLLLSYSQFCKMLLASISN